MTRGGARHQAAAHIIKSHARFAMPCARRAFAPIFPPHATKRKPADIDGLSLCPTVSGFDC
jgi:hypothetical protein